MLIEEKIQQAIGILDELGLDAWLTFVRETTESADPILPFLLPHHLTWQSALILTRKGDRIAIVGSHDAEPIRAMQSWKHVLGYIQSIRGPLENTLRRLDPHSLALNYSVDNVKADGLTHGMYLLLEEYLGETVYWNRRTSADGVITALRSRKTKAEVERITKAIRTTEDIYRRVASFASPGTTERAISDFMHREADSRGLALAWERSMCPIVTTGPDSMAGHALPSDSLTIRPGNIFHLDYGVIKNDYCSDLQRSWYVPKDGESAPPDDAQRAFDTVRQAIEYAKAALIPGAAGHEVDAAARKTVVDAGYEAYDHATGHHVGRAAHDGGGVLGPAWERYGRTPFAIVEPGHIYTLELGINLPGRGYLGLEEMVIITDTGCEYLSHPQTELWLLGAEPPAA